VKGDLETGDDEDEPQRQKPRGPPRSFETIEEDFAQPTMGDKFMVRGV